jgi:hypothetical protein
MNLKLYKINDDENVINKNIPADYLTFDITLRNDFDINNPILLLSNPLTDSVEDYNYCFLTDLNRYYFVDNIGLVNKSIIKLNCTCDVLETYKADILASKAQFMRNIEVGDYFDAQIPASINKSITTWQSDKGFSGPVTMVLTTIGI